MRRIKVWGKTPDEKIIEAHFSEEIQGVLYLNGEKGDEQEAWLFHHSEIKDGKGKDTIKIPYQERHNEKTAKGITTKTEDKKLEIPVEYKLEVKSIGQQQFILHRTGKITKQRVHSLVHGKDICDDIWDKLTDKEKAHLETIDVWDAYDELIKYLSASTKKPSAYIGAIQEIYNKTLFKNYKHYIRLEPEFEKIPSHKLVNCDVFLTVQAGKYSETKHFTEGGIFECKGEIKRTFAFTLPRFDIFKANLPGKYKIIKDIRRR